MFLKPFSRTCSEVPILYKTGQRSTAWKMQGQWFEAQEEPECLYIQPLRTRRTREGVMKPKWETMWQRTFRRPELTCSIRKDMDNPQNMKCVLSLEISIYIVADWGRGSTTPKHKRRWHFLDSHKSLARSYSVHSYNFFQCPLRLLRKILDTGIESQIHQ